MPAATANFKLSVYAKSITPVWLTSSANITILFGALGPDPILAFKTLSLAPAFAL